MTWSKEGKSAMLYDMFIPCILIMLDNNTNIQTNVLNKKIEKDNNTMLLVALLLVVVTTLVIVGAEHQRTILA
ncbi:MAG: hypothetical protein JO327_02430 [Nitrososphaeraceae archaeon]|nr:hypothetical protein [Nitrososphaeraceae archaeon]MBV9666968.1 hypothetical protein [Nitrososphaeraceae archaeon]